MSRQRRLIYWGFIAILAAILLLSFSYGFGSWGIYALLLAGIAAGLCAICYGNRVEVLYQSIVRELELYELRYLAMTATIGAVLFILAFF